MLNQVIPLAAGVEIGIDMQMLSDGSIEAESQLPQSLPSNPPSEPELEAPSEVTIGLNVSVAGGEEGGHDPQRPRPAVYRDTHSSFEAQVQVRSQPVTRILVGRILYRIPEGEAEYGRWLNSNPLLASEMTFNNMLDVSGGHYPLTAFPLLLGANGDHPLLLPETGMMFNVEGGGLFPTPQLPMLAEGGDIENGDPPPAVPLLDNRLFQRIAYPSMPMISMGCIHIFASIMDPTPENKKLIGVSVISFLANAGVYTWLNLRGEDLPNDDLTNISLKIIFVLTGTLTFYASISTMGTDWFTLPGIAFCGVLAIGAVHIDGLNRLWKKFTGTVKNATRKIRQLIA